MLILERMWLKMQYIEMTIEEASKLARKGATVLVATQDLDSGESIARFESKTCKECESIIKNGETIARVYDDFMNQLRVFTKKQIDVINFDSYGKLSTILLKE